jgi:hypothetical protein
MLPRALQQKNIDYLALQGSPQITDNITIFFLILFSWVALIQCRRDINQEGVTTSIKSYMIMSGIPEWPELVQCLEADPKFKGSGEVTTGR